MRPPDQRPATFPANHYDGRSTIAFAGVDDRVQAGILIGLLTEYDQVRPPRRQ